MVFDIIQPGKAQGAVGQLLAMTPLHAAAPGTWQSPVVHLQPATAATRQHRHETGCLSVRGFNCLLTAAYKMACCAAGAASLVGLPESEQYHLASVPVQAEPRCQQRLSWLQMQAMHLPCTAVQYKRLFLHPLRSRCALEKGNYCQAE